MGLNRMDVVTDRIRLGRWVQALEMAEADLCADEVERAERKARALGAIVRAAREIHEWRQALAATLNDEDEAETIRRSFEARIDRIRFEEGLAPLFGGDDDGGDEGGS
jgi:hypothetical protein